MRARMMSQTGDLVPGVTTLVVRKLLHVDQMQLQPVTAGLVCSWTSG